MKKREENDKLFMLEGAKSMGAGGRETSSVHYFKTIPSFLESPLTEEIEAREGILKPSSLAESYRIHYRMVKAPNS